MPDYRQYAPRKNSSPIASLGRMLDPMTHIPGVNILPNYVHDAAEYVAEKGNQALSPVFGALGSVAEKIDPVQMSLKATFPDQHMRVKEWVTNHPIDTMALVAAAYFGGAAAGGIGQAGAPAASTAGGAGGTAGIQGAGAAAITPTFSSGAITAPGAFGAGSTTGSLLGAEAITPALASGAYGGVAGAAGTGTLGTAGTSAGMAALTPSFASMGASSPSLLSQLKNLYKTYGKYNRYRTNVQQFADKTPSSRDRLRAQYNAEANALAERVLNSGQNPQRYR